MEIFPCYTTMNFWDVTSISSFFYIHYSIKHGILSIFSSVFSFVQSNEIKVEFLCKVYKRHLIKSHNHTLKTIKNLDYTITICSLFYKNKYSILLDPTIKSLNIFFTSPKSTKKEFTILHIVFTILYHIKFRL